MPSALSAMRLEAPKSSAKRMPGTSTRMQVLKRPPDPNASPLPTKVTFADMATSHRDRRRLRGGRSSNYITLRRRVALEIRQIERWDALAERAAHRSGFDKEQHEC